jgi:uncharacterized protein with ATP-grasp and redox domains
MYVWRWIFNVRHRIHMKKEEAIKMNEHLSSMIHHANHVLFVANNSGDVELKKKTQEVLGAVVTELDFELLEPIYQEFPELRPDDL